MRLEQDQAVQVAVQIVWQRVGRRKRRRGEEKNERRPGWMGEYVEVV